MTKCSVKGCASYPPHFKFPTSKVLVRKWLEALGPRVSPKELSSGALCSRHFDAGEWECARGRVRLKKGVVPSRFSEEEKQNDTTTIDDVPNNDKHDTNDSPDTTQKSEENDTPKHDSQKDCPQEDSSELIDKSGLKERDPPQERDIDMNGRESGEERVQENDKETDDAANSSSLDSKDSKDKSKESTPKLPSGPRDIDKDKVEDIEDLLTYYHIKQNNIHATEELPVEPAATTEDAGELKNGEEEAASADPVFIEISVDKETSASGGDGGDCLMVLESVQVDVDPSALMMEDHDYQEMELETLEIDEEPPPQKEDPISLLTSSDEDDVIIQEPHIDTVEVSDETDEDDMPLVKLLRKRRAEKKKNVTKKQDKEPSIANITWGMYEYYCVQCRYKTSVAGEYRRHMAAHAKVILMCQLCGYMTASSSQFAKHEKQHGEKTYKCHLCDFKAKRNMSLVYHMKTHKETAKEFKCGECDYVAYSDQAILKHLRFCGDGKKHKCDKCEYSTKKRSDLKRHKSRRHVDDEDKDEDYVPPW